MEKVDDSTVLEKLDELKVFESLDLIVKNFIDENMVVQLGVQPVRIDILSSISGVNFQDAYVTRVEKLFGKIKANFISREYIVLPPKSVFFLLRNLIAFVFFSYLDTQISYLQLVAL